MTVNRCQGRSVYDKHHEDEEYKGTEWGEAQWWGLMGQAEQQELGALSRCCLMSGLRWNDDEIVESEVRASPSRGHVPEHFNGVPAASSPAH